MRTRKQNKKNYPARNKPKRSEAVEYEYHLPVLLGEAVDFLITDANGIYIDGTLGGGGHTAEILRRLDFGGRILAFDKDSEAIAHCKEKFSDELARGAHSRLTVYNKCFSEAYSIEWNNKQANGLLLDLGVSSRQLDNNLRGIGYRTLSSLDMRFGDGESTAEDILHAASEEEIERLLRNYGEEPFARVIARRIVQRRRASALKTTFDLRDAVIESTPSRLHSKSLSRVFQAVRIAVNKELQILEETLANTVPLLAPGGRLVVISYHSLEDRIVKSSFKKFSEKSSVSSPYEKVSAEKKQALKIIAKKPIIPTDEEITRNPRARSAKMRIAEKLI